MITDIWDLSERQFDWHNKGYFGALGRRCDRIREHWKPSSRLYPVESPAIHQPTAKPEIRSGYGFMVFKQSSFMFVSLPQNYCIFLLWRELPWCPILIIVDSQKSVSWEALSLHITIGTQWERENSSFWGKHQWAFILLLGIFPIRRSVLQKSDSLNL